MLIQVGSYSSLDVFGTLPNLTYGLNIRLTSTTSVSQLSKWKLFKYIYFPFQVHSDISFAYWWGTKTRIPYIPYKGGQCFQKTIDSAVHIILGYPTADQSGVYLLCCGNLYTLTISEAGTTSSAECEHNVMQSLNVKPQIEL